jgi:hypothetical protein
MAGERPDKITAGSIHLFFEGYFVYNNSRMPVGIGKEILFLFQTIS